MLYSRSQPSSLLQERSSYKWTFYSSWVIQFIGLEPHFVVLSPAVQGSEGWSGHSLVTDLDETTAILLSNHSCSCYSLNTVILLRNSFAAACCIPVKLAGLGVCSHHVTASFGKHSVKRLQPSGPALAQAPRVQGALRAAPGVASVQDSDDSDAAPSQRCQHPSQWRSLRQHPSQWWSPFKRSRAL